MRTVRATSFAAAVLALACVPALAAQADHDGACWQTSVRAGKAVPYTSFDAKLHDGPCNNAAVGAAAEKTPAAPAAAAPTPGDYDGACWQHSTRPGPRGTTVVARTAKLHDGPCSKTSAEKDAGPRQAALAKVALTPGDRNGDCWQHSVRSGPNGTTFVVYGSKLHDGPCNKPATSPDADARVLPKPDKAE